MDYPQYESQHKQTIWNLCANKGQALLAKGMDFLTSRKKIEYDNADQLREELVVNARYLHRGYYCPSPIQDIIVTNARRGKILARSTKRSKISHRYIYSSDNKLMIVEASLPGGSKKSEYLVYDNEKVYGFSFDAWGTLVGVSEEVYNDNLISSYFCASCYNPVAGKEAFGITSIHYEVYHYDDIGLCETDFYYITPTTEQVILSTEDIDTLVQGKKFRFVRENEYLLGFYSVKFNGEQFDDNPYIEKITIPKKA